MDFTSREIIIAVLGSGSFIGACLAVATLIVSMRKTSRDEKNVRDKNAKDEASERDKVKQAQSVDMRRVEMQADQAISDGWMNLVTERNTEIKRIREEFGVEIRALRDEIKALKEASTFSRPTVTKIYRGLASLEQRIKSFRLAQCPDDVAEAINTWVIDLLQAIGDLRDLLP